jgi:putative oxidoreductase
MANNLEARLNSYYPLALTAFRVVFGLLFLCDGLSKLIGWPAPFTAPIGHWPEYYAGCIETITGALITLGLFTRPAAFLACGEMAVAYFTAHLPHHLSPIRDAFPINNHGEAAVMYCFAFFLLIFTGGGPYALDARRGGWRSTAAPRRMFSGPSRRTFGRRR